MLLLIITFVSSIIFRKKTVPTVLLSTALKNENNGYYEEALTNYETALTQFKKTRCHTRYHKDLKNKITDKIKVLHTVIQYQKSFL